MISYYFTILFLLTILSFRTFLNNNLDSLVFKLKPIDNTLSNINSFFQNIFNSNKTFENGKIDLLFIIVLIYFGLTGYFYTDYPIQIITTIIIFEFIIIYFYNNGRIITILLTSIISFLIGYYFGKKRLQNKYYKRYKENQNKIIELDLPE